MHFTTVSLSSSTNAGNHKNIHSMQHPAHNVFQLRTDLSELPEELPIAEENHSKWENETSDEESDDVTVVCYVG